MRNKEIMETLLMIEKLRSLGFSVSAPAPRTMPELRTQGSYKRSPAQRKRMAAAKRKWWRERKKQA